MDGEVDVERASGSISRVPDDRNVSEVNSILLCRKGRLGGAFILSPSAVGLATTPEASC